MSRRLSLLAVALAVLGLPAATQAVDAEPTPPTSPMEKVAAIVPGTPLGAWADAASHPLAFVIWPETEAAGALDGGSSRSTSDSSPATTRGSRPGSGPRRERASIAPRSSLVRPGPGTRPALPRTSAGLTMAPG